MSGSGLFPDSNLKWRPAELAAQQEFELVRRALERRTRSVDSASPTGDIVGPLLSVGIGILVLAVFAVWLLLGPPLPR